MPDGGGGTFCVEPVAVGLAFWALGGPASMKVDSYEVRSLHGGD